MPQKRGHVKRPRRAVKIWQIMERCQNNRCGLGPGTRISLWGAMEWHKTSTFLVWVLAVNISPWGSILPNFPPWGTQLRASLCCPAAFSPVPTRAPRSHNQMVCLNHERLVREQTEMIFSTACVGGERKKCKDSWYFSIFLLPSITKSKGLCSFDSLTLSLWLSILLPEIPTTETIHL